MDTLLAIEGLSKRFGPILAVDDIGFSVERGEVLGFLGPNGAGKSTTMRMITGYLPPTSGRITVCGLDLAEHPIKVRRRIGFLPEGAPAYGDMTPSGLLDFVARMRHLGRDAKRRQIDAVVGRLDLGAVLHQPIETLSKGFLDEPTDGLDPNQKHEVRRGDSVRRVEVEAAAGGGYTILRDAEGGEFRLEGLGSGEEIAPDANLSRLANALSSVRMEDVRLRDDVDWPDERPTARFVTFDGLQVTVRLAKIGEEHFATFDAEQVEPAPAPAGDAAPVAGATGASEIAASEAAAGGSADEAASGSATTAKASGDDAADAAESSARESAAPPNGEDPTADADALQARLGAWAYQIPESLFNRLTTARSDLVRDKDGTS